MKKICSVLATLTLILGLIGAFILAKDLGMPNLFDTERNWGVTIGVFIGISCSAVVLSVILFAISEILENQEYIIASNKQVSPTLLGSLEKEAEEKDILSNGGWKCPKCGNVNRSYTNTCKCGAKKEEDVSISFGGWKCPKCGEMNRSHFITCKCGQKKIQVKD